MKSATPEQIASATALRSAGFTALSISQRLGLSVRTIQRIVSRSGTEKGTLRNDLVNAAKADLLSRLSSSESIRFEVARLVDDDLAHVARLREIMSDASEFLRSGSLDESATLMRAAAAYSTALKNTSEIIRGSLRSEALATLTVEELPELVIRELTGEEVVEINSSRQDESWGEPQHSSHEPQIVELGSEE